MTCVYRDYEIKTKMVQEQMNFGEGGVYWGQSFQVGGMSVQWGASVQQLSRVSSGGRGFGWWVTSSHPSNKEHPANVK